MWRSRRPPAGIDWTQLFLGPPVRAHEHARLSGTELAQRARSFRDELPVILLSGRENDSHGYPLIRKPILRSDLQRVVAETSGPAKGR
jgi:hypothetical protein